MRATVATWQANKHATFVAGGGDVDNGVARQLDCMRRRHAWRQCVRAAQHGDDKDMV